MIQVKEITRFFGEVFQNYSDDNAFTLGASLAYYTVFSIAPIIIIIISTAGIFVGQEAVQGEIYRELKDLFGAETALQLQTIVKGAYRSGQSTWATIFGIATLIVGATGVISEMKNSMNIVWEIKEKPKSSILNLLRNRFLSFSFILGLGFIFLVSLMLNSVVIGFAGDLARQIGFETLTVTIISFGVSFLMTVLIFALLFKFLPDAKVGWQEVIVGGLFTAILFAIGKYLIGFYIGNSNIASGFGAAGSLVVLLVWVYYSSQILFLGAEFTYIWAKRYGKTIRPDKGAVRVIRQEEIIIPKKKS